MNIYILALAILGLVVVGAQSKTDSHLSEFCTELFSNRDKCKAKCSEDLDCHNKKLEEGDKDFEQNKCLQICGATPDVDIPYHTCTKRQFAWDFFPCVKRAGCEKYFSNSRIVCTFCTYSSRSKLASKEEYTECRKEQCECLYEKIKDDKSGCAMEERDVDKICLSKVDREKKNEERKKERQEKRKQEQEQRKADWEQRKADRKANNGNKKTWGEWKRRNGNRGKTRQGRDQ